MEAPFIDIKPESVAPALPEKPGFEHLLSGVTADGSRCLLYKLSEEQDDVSAMAKCDHAWQVSRYFLALRGLQPGGLLAVAAGYTTALL